MGKINMGDGYGTPGDDAREELCRIIAATSDPESPAATVAAIVANPDVVLRALGYESFLHHGKQHDNDPASSRCYPGCGQAWRNPKELIH